MAFLFADSFDHYSFSQITQKWTNRNPNSNNVNATISLANGRRATNGYNISIANGATDSGATGALNRALPAVGSTAIIGFAFRPTGTTQLTVTTAETNSSFLLRIRYAGLAQIWFRMNIDGSISAMRGTTVLGTSGFMLNDAVTRYLEFKVVVHPSAGSVLFRVDGFNDPLLNLSGINTDPQGSGTWNGFSIAQMAMGANTSGTWNFDDLYVLDASGSTSNDFLNDVRIDAVFPDADGANSDWTPNSGSVHYDRINQNPPDDDTTYNVTSGVGDKDTFDFPNAPVAASDILAVQLVSYSRKTDSGSAGHKGIFRTGGTDYLTDEIGVPSSYAFVRRHFDRNPADASIISDTVFNSAQFGYQKSS